MPLGYDVVIFEKLAEPGGLMRINIPSFRLPASGARRRGRLHPRHGRRHPVQLARHEHASRCSARATTRCSSAAARRRARTSTSPAAPKPSANIHIGIEWLGVGALRPHRDDRQARADHRRRQHGDGLLPHVAPPRRHRREGHRAPRSRKYFKASPWELEDAEEEGVEIVENHAPKRFVLENGKLVGMEFERLRWSEENGKQKSEVIDTVVIPCDDVILAIGQENAFPWIERDIGIDFDKHGHAGRRQDDDAVDARRRVLRRRRGVGTGEHHLGGGARAPGGDLDPQSLPGRRRSPSVRRTA